MIAKHDSEPSRPIRASAADHQEVGWQFDADEIEPVESRLGRHSSGPSGLVITPDRKEPGIPSKSVR